jgi:hypothetical protein
MHVVDLSLGTNKERKENRRKAQQRSAGGGPGRGCTHPPPRTLAHSRTPSHTRTLAHSHTRTPGCTHALTLTRTLAHSHTRLRSAVLWLSHMERRRRTNACMYSPTAKARTILNLTTFAWAAPVSPSFHLSLYRPCSLCFPRMHSRETQDRPMTWRIEALEVCQRRARCAKGARGVPTASLAATRGLDTRT